jgi:Mrp family chromosome partitioning ATPase
MGRMFDVLRQSMHTPDDESSPLPAPADDDFVSDTAPEEVPFIEVGPARSLEASPTVLAVPVPRLRIASPPVEPAAPHPLPLSPQGRGVRGEGRDGAISVALRALPGGLAIVPPQQRFAPDLVAFHQPDHPGAVEYREVAATLQEGSKGASRVWLFLGAVAGAGTTSVVLNLAICLARTRGLRVIVVDANANRPAVAERLGLCGRPGVAEVLDGRESLDRAIQETGVERLAALTAGQPDVTGTPIKGACRPVLRQLRDLCDVVLIDGGVDVDSITQACDAVYLVVHHARAEEAATTERSWTLLRQGAPLRGCIVTGR